MSDPKPLVEVLREKAAEHAKVRALVAASDPVKNLDIDRIAAGFESCYLDMADELAPYAARLAALERVFEAAKTYVNGDRPGTAWRELQSALAAVPEIPEKTDG